MNTREFVAAYPLNIASAKIHKGEHAALIEQPLEWSYQLGQMMHNRLTGQPGEPDDADRFAEYRHWLDHDSFQIEIGLYDKGEVGARALSSLNFHLLNRSMHGMWRPVLNPELAWGSETDRQHRIAASARTLAMNGYFYYHTRQKMADLHGSELLFDNEWDGGEMAILNRSLTGMVQEIDAGIVLLGVAARHPGMTVVPAPLNFEAVNRQINADYLVIDCLGRRAVGVQVKSTLLKSVRDQADQSRIIFIDGSTDFGNRKRMRASYDSAEERRVSWPGMIAMSRVAELKPSNQRIHGLRFTKAMSGAVRVLMQDVQADYEGSVERIEARIMDVL